MNTKKVYLTLFFSFTVLFTSAQWWSQERAVKAWVEVSEEPANIEIKWKEQNNRSWVSIGRRIFQSGDNFKTIASNIPNSQKNYIDSDVQIGITYEYSITIQTSRTEPFSQTGAAMTAHSYITSGIKVPVKNNMGRLLLVHSTLIKDSLQTELNQLMEDLWLDGWKVISLEAKVDDNVEDIKKVIDDYANEEDGLKAIYLLGNVPVPYSGSYCFNNASPPDGHHQNAGGHCGAWVADVYYGVVDGEWKDVLEVTNATRDDNKNFPGDGKFDNNTIPGDVTIAVGRVDLSRLPALEKSEVELTRNYLNKARDYKLGSTSYLNQGVISDNFKGMQEGFGSGAIRDFYAICGEDGLIEAKLDAANENDNYLLGYGCGAGSYTSCNGVGRTADLKDVSYSIFNHIFGSYFGDFDISNNFLRAVLGSEKNGLCNFWSGRPKWVMAPFGLGYTLGDITIISQNNNWNYDLSFFQNGPHIALMGDPTLRIHPVMPPEALSYTLIQLDTVVELNWAASSSDGVLGYNIYRAAEKDGEYRLVNKDNIITNSNFTDDNPHNGSTFYMVKAVRLENTGSGSFYNESLAAYVEAQNVKGTHVDINKLTIQEFAVYPNPATNQVTISLSDNQTVQGKILNVQGMVMNSFTINGSGIVNISHLPSGFYFIELGNYKVEKLIKL
jgi:hypothetical protein